jgi:hypothetical protein
MNYGLYLSAQGAEAQSQRLDVISNNLANAQTGAFKRDLAIFQAHRPYDVENNIAENLPGGLNESTGGISLAGVITDFSDAQTQVTGGVNTVPLVGKNVNPQFTGGVFGVLVALSKALRSGDDVELSRLDKAINSEIDRFSVV